MVGTFSLSVLSCIAFVASLFSHWLNVLDFLFHRNIKQLESVWGGGGIEGVMLRWSF